MPGITLAQIREAADREYGPFVVEGIPGGDVTLLSPLRLSKAKRKRLTDLQKRQDNLGEDAEDMEKLLLEMVVIVAESKAGGDRLIKAMGEDLAQLSVVLNEYGKAGQMGEASPSPSSSTSTGQPSTATSTGSTAGTLP